MNDSSDRNPVEALAEEFLERYRRGERPALSEYTQNYPDLADDIRELFPALVMLEGVRPTSLTDNNLNPLRPAGAGGITLERLGDYRILREIGRGGMGIVYEAEQESLGRHVALKVLPTHSLLNPQHLQRFQREARAAARLHHTNIVPVFGVGDHEGLHYYVMQFIHGQGLDQVLVELAQLRQSASKLAAEGAYGACGGGVAKSLLSGVFAVPPSEEKARPSTESSVSGTQSSTLPLSLSATDEGKRYWQSVAQIGIQVADALTYAHSQGTLHRDIKPSNLLLDGQGIVWITDFGLAKAQDSEDLTHTGDVVGTLRYMAPERFQGKSDGRSDVYSLGLTLYEMLTLRPAFDETERSRLLHQVMHADALRPRKLNAAVPRDLETIVLKAIAREPAHRYQSAAELAADLQRFRDDKPILARPVSEAEKMWRWCRRNPSLSGLILAFVLSLLAGIGGVTWKWREAEDRRKEAVAEGQNVVQEQQRTKKQRDEAVAARTETQRVLANVVLDKGTALAERGEISAGLFWMLEALKLAPTEENEADRRLRWMIRTNLSAWRSQSASHKWIIEQPHQNGWCACLPDGKRFVTSDAMGSIMVWEIATGQGKSLLKVKSGDPVLSPDGKSLLTASPTSGDKSPHQLQRWNVETGQRIGPAIPHPSPVRSITFLPDSEQFLTGSEDGKVRLFDATGKMLREGFHHESAAVVDLALHRDGKTLATATIQPRNERAPAAAYLWDLQSGEQLAGPMQHKAGVHQITFSPDGQRVVTSSWDHTAQAWHVFGPARGTAAGPALKHRGPVYSAQFSPDGQTLATGSDEGITLWSSANYEELSGRPALLRCYIYRLAWSADGQTLVGVGPYSGKGVIYVCQTSRTLTRPASTASEWKRKNFWNRDGIQPWFQQAFASYSPDAKRILIGGQDGKARLFDTATGQPAQTRAGGPFRHTWKATEVTAFSPDGRFFATSSRDPAPVGEARLWDAVSGAAIGPPLKHVNYVAAMAFSPDGKILATGGYDCAVTFWDTATGKQIKPLLRQKDIVLRLAFSPDGKTLAVGHSLDYSGAAGVILWDVASRKPRHRVDTGTLLLVVLESGRLASFARGWHKYFSLLDPASGKVLATPVPESVQINSLAFSPNNQRILTSSVDGTLRLRDAVLGTPIGVPMQASVRANVAVFSPDPEGKLILAGYADGSARLWDQVSQKPIGPPLLHGQWIAAVAFAPDGNAFYTTSQNGATRRWPMPAPIADATSIERLQLQLEVRTGLVMDKGQIIVPLTARQWQQRHDQLTALEGSAQSAYDGAVSDVAYHDARARDAEADNDALAARWHLDRLIALKQATMPHSLALCRRGRLQSDEGKFAAAETDYAEAEKHGSRDSLLLWYRYCIADCLADNHLETALWYLNRTIATAPRDWQLYADRALIFGKHGKQKERDADLMQAIACGAESGFILPLAEDFARRGELVHAAENFALAMERGPCPAWIPMHQATVCVKLGQLQDYRKICVRTVADADADSLYAAHVAAWVCTLAPGAVMDYQRPINLAENAAARARPEIKASMLSTLGAVLYRAGRFKEAVKRLNEGMDARNGEATPYDCVFLGMAHHRLGETEQAKKYLAAQAVPAVKEFSWDHLAFELLRVEAESVFKSARTPSVRQ